MMATPMAPLASVADYGDLCGECPVWDGASRNLYWTDCVGLRFYRYDWATQSHAIVKEGVEVTAFRLNQPGGFAVANTAGLWLWDGAGALAPIAQEVDGIPCQMNDATVDPAGRLLAGTCFYSPDGEYRLGHLLQVATDGRVAILEEGFRLANGLGFSPDGRTLYFTDSVARRIYAYDYNAASGQARGRRVLVQVPADEGVPDGMAVDAGGFLWSAQWYGGCVVRYDPDGKVERRLPVPAKQVSSVAFGGDDLTHLFITTAARSEPMPVMPPGYDPNSGNFGGQLYHLDLGSQGIRGLPAYLASITLRK